MYLAADMLMNAAALAIWLRLMGRGLYPVRIAAGAACAAAIACLLRFMIASRALQAVFWAPTAFAMMAAADFQSVKRKPVRCLLTMFSAMGLLGGTVTALEGATESLAAAYALGAAAAIICAASAGRARRAAGQRFVRLRLSLCGRRVQMDALVDSGNCLRDYLTHRPVIVLPQRRGERLFPLSEAALRPLFADTAAGRQMLWCAVPQAAEWLDEKRWRPAEALVAFSPAMESGSPALFPASLLETD